MGCEESQSLSILSEETVASLFVEDVWKFPDSAEAEGNEENIFPAGEGRNTGRPVCWVPGQWQALSEAQEEQHTWEMTAEAISWLACMPAYSLSAPHFYKSELPA